MPYAWQGELPPLALATASLLPSAVQSMELLAGEALAPSARRLLQDPLYSPSSQRSIMRLPPHVYLIAFVVLVLVMSALLMCHCYRMVRIARAVRSGDHLTVDVINNNVKRGTPPAVIQALPVRSVHDAIAQRRSRAATSQASKLVPPPAAVLEDVPQNPEGQQQQQQQEVELQDVPLHSQQQDQQGRQQQQGAGSEGSRGGLLAALQALNPSKLGAVVTGTAGVAGTAAADATGKEKEPSFASCHSSSVGHEACAICFDDFHDDEDVKELPCGHFFHPACIDAWLVRDVRCPLCVQPVASQEALAAAAPPSSTPSAAGSAPAADAAATNPTATTSPTAPGTAAVAAAAGASAGAAAAAAPRTWRRRDIIMDVLRHPFGGFTQAEEQRALRALREQEDAERAVREVARLERREARRARRAVRAAAAGGGSASAGSGTTVGMHTAPAAAPSAAGTSAAGVSAAGAPAAGAAAGGSRLPAGPVAEGHFVDIELGQQGAGAAAGGASDVLPVSVLVHNTDGEQAGASGVQHNSQGSWWRWVR